MARAVRDYVGTTWGLSETGATGPTGNRYGDGAGHACIAIAGPVEHMFTIETRRSGWPICGRSPGRSKGMKEEGAEQ